MWAKPHPVFDGLPTGLMLSGQRLAADPKQQPVQQGGNQQALAGVALPQCTGHFLDEGWQDAAIVFDGVGRILRTHTANRFDDLPDVTLRLEVANLEAGGQFTNLCLNVE